MLNKYDLWKIITKGFEETASRLDGLTHLMQDMVKLEDTIKNLEEKIDGRVKNTTDSLIQMAMVNRGEPQTAVMHKATAQREYAGDRHNGWEAKTVEEDPEEVWPPPNSDVVRMDR